MPKTLIALSAALFLGLGCAEPTPEQSPTEAAFATMVPTPTIDPFLLGLAWDIVRHNRRSVIKTPGELADNVLSAYEGLKKTRKGTPRLPP